jgi:transcriptional regulator with XRE-family HTH domain
MSFGETIRNKRKQLSLSQKELATRVMKDDGTPISPQYLNDIEQGKRNPDSDAMIEHFAHVLELEKDILYFWARKLPADLTKLNAPPEKIVRAYTAFRKALKS